MKMLLNLADVALMLVNRIYTERKRATLAFRVMSVVRHLMNVIFVVTLFFALYQLLSFTSSPGSYVVCPQFVQLGR